MDNFGTISEFSVYARMISECKDIFLDPMGNIQSSVRSDTIAKTIAKGKATILHRIFETRTF